MNFIKEKKIDSRIVIAVLYAAFCFAYFVPTRGTVALFAINYNLPSFLNNDIVAFIAAGIVPTLAYEIITSVSFRFLQRGGAASIDGLLYALRFFYIGAAIVSGGVKLVFLFFPLGSIWAFILTDTIVPLLFFVGYMFFALKTYVDKTQYSRFIYSLGGVFFVVYAVLAVMGLVMGVAV